MRKPVSKSLNWNLRKIEIEHEPCEHDFNGLFIVEYTCYWNKSPVSCKNIQSSSRRVESQSRDIIFIRVLYLHFLNLGYEPNKYGVRTGISPSIQTFMKSIMMN